MFSLTPSEKELCLIKKFTDEAFRIYGIDCELFSVDSQNMYLDDRELKKGVPYKILLQEYVDTRLLSNLKWSTIDLDKEAITALMPIQYCDKNFNLKEFDVIKLYNGDQYQIREIAKQYLIGTLYAVRLITYKDEPNRNRNEKQMKTNFFLTDREEIQ